MKKETKNSLEKRIRAIAESGKGKGMPNWFKLPQNNEKRALHIEVCKKLVEYSDANGNYPITYLVYFGVGKNAHRLPTFLGGYSNFDEKKVKKIFSWLKLFAKHNGNKKLFRNPNLAHALCRFYDKYSKKTEDFKAALEKYEPNPKVENFSMVANGLGIAKTTNEAVEVAAAEEVLEPVMA